MNELYGQSYVLAAALPAAVGTMFTIGWIGMAAITVLFLVASLIQLLRPTNGYRP
ncbi:MAG: hypothetical protein ABSH51_06770 [Solirubrobacteraceae bacterium]